MKKLLAFTLIALLAIAAWNSIDTSDMVVNIDGDEYSGPMGALLGLFFGGIGLLIGTVVVTCVAVFVGFLMASLGILMVAGLALAAVIVATMVAPLTLPLLIPVAIIWYIVSRNRKQRDREQALKQQPVV
jgi:peptidoglycan/LPS O-acetylase OafA/YrhL